MLKHQYADAETALRDSNRLMLFGHSADSAEGIRSFVEKRKPAFAPFDPSSKRDTLKRELLQEACGYKNQP